MLVTIKTSKKRNRFGHCFGWVILLLVSVLITFVPWHLISISCSHESRPPFWARRKHLLGSGLVPSKRLKFCDGHWRYVPFTCDVHQGKLSCTYPLCSLFLVLFDFHTLTHSRRRLSVYSYVMQNRTSLHQFVFTSISIIFFLFYLRAHNHMHGRLLQ